jgi:hypothetical protein
LDQVQAALDELSTPESLTPLVRYLLERGRVFSSAAEPGRLERLRRLGGASEGA